MIQARVLIVEDDHGLREAIVDTLLLAGYVCLEADSGEAALLELNRQSVDMVISDIQMGGMDGHTLLSNIRQKYPQTPVLLMTAYANIDGAVRAMREGAIDYLAKPFHLAELEARVRSLTRRQFIQRNVCLRCGRLSFDTKSRVAMVDGQPVPLTRKESSVLEYLLLHQGRPVSQEELMEHVWDGRVDAFSNSIRVHISALRKKLRAALGYDPIRNRIGEGYEVGESEQ